MGSLRLAKGQVKATLRQLVVQNQVIAHREINECFSILVLSEIESLADAQRLDYAEITKAILKDFQWSPESVML